METREILNQLDNGTITQAETIDLMLQHTSRAYAIGAYLDTRKQCTEYRDQLYALQDGTPRPIMDGNVITDLIDHALDSGYIGPTFAETHLISAGMDATTSRHHVQTILAIKDRDLERVVYLDNPETAPRYCTRCGRKVTAAELSRRGICIECSTAAVKENLIALDTKKGPAYLRWRNAVLVWAYTLEEAEIAERHPIGAGTLGDYIDQDKTPGCDGACEECDATECPNRTHNQEIEGHEVVQ